MLWEFFFALLQQIAGDPSSPGTFHPRHVYSKKTGKICVQISLFFFQGSTFLHFPGGVRLDICKSKISFFAAIRSKVSTIPVILDIYDFIENGP